MQITTLEQLGKTEPDQVLFLINPFEQGDQTDVTIKCITILNVFNDKIECVIGRNGDHFNHNEICHFTDMLTLCKYIYTSKIEAKDMLKQIHKGLHDDEVKAHHESCIEMYDSSDFEDHQYD